MSSQSKDWSDEQDAQLEVAIDQAVSSILEQFDLLIEELEPESRSLIRDFFAGTPVSVLAKQRELSSEQVESWLSRVRRQLGQKLRATCRVKQ